MLKHRVLTAGIEQDREQRIYANLSPEQQAIVDEENAERSMRRTQKEIADLIDCNEFQYFGTFTFSPEKINRYDTELVENTMSKWLNNARRQSPNLTYMLFEEAHKDGAIHFHALIGSYEGVLADSGKKWHGNAIFNLTAFKYGFTNFTAIRDKAKSANYCRKYITKALATKTNKRRYWASKNLKRPERIENLELNQAIALLGKNQIEVTNTYENEHVIQHTISIQV